MKALLVVCVSVSLLASGRAQGSNETMTDLARAADSELTRSVQELTQLREQIASEKLPMAQELTGLEEKLAQLRKDHDRIARSVDEGNLELTQIRTEMKARQDELAYTATLLDDYARTFETRIQVGEDQYCGATIDKAKQATENTALSQAEKFAAQVDLVRLSLRRVFDLIGGMRFPGVAVDLLGNVVEGQFAVVGPVAMFRGKTGIAGLAVAQSGSARPLIRPLDGAIQAGIESLVQDGEGTLPLDPSRGGALKALIQKTNIIHIFEKGGPIMWPLLCASVLALGTVLERLLFLMNERRKRSPQALDNLFKSVQRGDVEGAIRDSKSSRDFVVRALSYALVHKEQSLPSALLYARARELKRFRRGIPILDTVITLAPLLGLLGTVTGMMGSFSLIGGELSSPGAITGGIAEALIATAFGLGIAIISLIPFNFLNARLDDASHDIESASAQLEILVQPMVLPPTVSRPYAAQQTPAVAG
jgi:biopolymer transport protein ExbB